MMRLCLVRTWSGPAKSHRTLQVETQGRLVHVWLHAFERVWCFSGDGMLCFGCGWFSVNAFDTKAQ